ncbi:MAG: hypothetical protein ACI86X_000372 [Moritella sp.]
MGLHGLVLWLTLNWLSMLPLQLVYAVTIAVLCGYHCRRHWLQQYSFTYFTSGFIQLVEEGELLQITTRSRCSDMFIVLILKSNSNKNNSAGLRCQSIYIMRDAVPDPDYRRLIRTVKMLS